MAAKHRIIKSGTMTRIIEAEQIGDILPAQNYAVNFSMNMGFYLTDREPFSLPEKIYGENKFADRVVKTYKSRKKGMGVLLSGPKGTGKTVEAKQIAIKSELPVLTISQGFGGQAFVEFVESIKTPSCIFIDEFEKVYEEEENRNVFLSIMDGTSASRHLFVLTSNKTRVGEFFENRPGRIRYHKKYGHLDDVIIRSIIQDKLKDKTKVDEFVQQISGINNISVDSITSLIDECNLHNELPRDFMEIFNVESERPRIYALRLEKEGWSPKRRLKNPKDRGRAMEICRYANDDSYNFEEDFSDWVADRDKLCEKRKTVYTSSYNTPFLHNNGGNPNTERPNIYATLLTEEGVSFAEAQQTNINWTYQQMESFRENREGFVARHKDGSVLYGQPSASSSSKDYQSRYSDYED